MTKRKIEFNFVSHDDSTMTNHVWVHGTSDSDDESSTSDTTKDQPDREHIEALTELLARLINDPDDARRVAQRAGFPAQHLPRYGTASQFWSGVLQDAINGRIRLTALFEVIESEFPHNSNIRSCRESVLGGFDEEA